MSKLFRRGRIWFVRVIDHTGKVRRRSTKCTDHEAAKIAARRFERESADPAHAAAHTATLDRCVKLTLAEVKRRGRAEGTLHMYRVKVGHLARVFGGTAKMASITAPAVDGFVSRRQSEGASDSTIGKELTALRQTLKVARRAGLYPADPATVLPVQWSSGYKPRKTFVQQAHVGALLDELPPARARHIAFILATGARDSEATRAQVEDVDLDAWLVRLRGEKTAAAARVVPVVAIARPLLALAMIDAPKSGALFPPWKGIRTHLRRLCDRLKIERLSPNDLRRSLATWLRESGASSEHLGKLLGHTDSRMAERVYGQLGTEALRRLLDGGENGGSILGRTSGTNEHKQDKQDGGKMANHSVIAVPRDGIEPPTRGFSSRVAAVAKDADPLRNSRQVRAAGLDLDLYLRLRVTELQTEGTVRRALRDGVRKALARDERGTHKALARAVAAMGVS